MGDNDGSSGQNKRKFSLSFSSKKGTKRSKGSVKIQVQEKEREKIYVSSLSTSKLKKLGQNKKEALVIPLRKDNWEEKEVQGGNSGSSRADGGSTNADEKKMEVEAPSKSPPRKPKEEEKPVYGLVDRKKMREESAKKSNAGAKPMLLMNQVPGLDRFDNDSEKFRHDISMRPQESTLADYERIPVEDFGKAMLRGMGWKPGGKIGVGANAKHVEPIQFLKRGYRAGLGADDKLVALKNAKKERKYIRPGEKRGVKMPQVAKDADGKRRHYQKIGEKLQTVKDLVLEKGALVEFVAGAHKGLFGRVEKMILEIGGGRCVVCLNIGHALVKAKNKNLKVLDGDALPKNHQAFATKQVKTASSKDGRGKESSGKKSKKKVRKVTWVRPNIRVRVVSKSLEGGRYYNKKGTVYDVTSMYEFTVLMKGDQKLVEHVIERNVDTALPKAGGRVMVVLGEHKGKVGTLIERNSKAKKGAVVQLDDEVELCICSFDQVAEYVP